MLDERKGFWPVDASYGALLERTILDKKPYIDATRAILVTEAYQQYQNQPPVLKRAYMLKNILEKMPIYIEDETLIVGNQAASNKDAPIFPEYTMQFCDG